MAPATTSAWPTRRKRSCASSRRSRQSWLRSSASTGRAAATLLPLRPRVRRRHRAKVPALKASRAMDAPDLGGSKPLLFLSHAGADIEAARTLKRRLEAAPDARAAGLRVWFDKDDLRAGASWMAQLEEVIERRATAFA